MTKGESISRGNMKTSNHSILNTPQVNIWLFSRWGQVDRNM